VGVDMVLRRPAALFIPRILMDTAMGLQVATTLTSHRGIYHTLMLLALTAELSLIK